VVPIPAIPRIDRGTLLPMHLGSNSACLPINGRGHDHTMQMFQTPVMLQQLARQPVEQLRMRRFVSRHAEVAGSIRQAAAEVELPYAIGDHTRDQGIIAMRQPLRQSDAPPAGAMLRWLDATLHTSLGYAREAGTD